jgi:Do/DeqQ family serine protease
MEKRKSMRWAGVAAVGAIAGAALALGIGNFVANGRTAESPATSSIAAVQPVAVVRQVPQSQSDIALSFAPVARAAQPSVVNIYTARVTREVQDPFFRMFRSQPRVAHSLGSGVIVDSSGLIVTNNHVVRGADQIVVALADRREFPAELVFADAKLDLALLRIDPAGAPLPVARLGDSDRAEIGDLVLAIGNPFGVGQTVTQGIVSANARTGIGVSDTDFFIQTDASINQGNSGGALVSMTSEVIGINTAIFSGSGGNIGIGFAIPSNMVKVFLNQARTGTRTTAWLGVEGVPVDGARARAAGLDRVIGVAVLGVSPGSPAERAGLRSGDIVLAVDGNEVSDPASLRYRVATKPVGETATLTVLRGGRGQMLQARLTAPPENPPRQLTRIPAGSVLGGVSVANLSPALAQELGAGLPERGVVVVEVDQRAPLARFGAPRPGDLIESVNGQTVERVGDVVDAARSSQGGAVQFTLNRSGQRAECVFQPPGRFGCRQVAPRVAGVTPPAGRLPQS